MLKQLIGANGTIYFGKDDGKFWTNMISPVSVPALSLQNTHRVIEYTRQYGYPLLASAQMVPNSRWLILVKFFLKKFLEASAIFLRRLIMAYIVLVAAGSFIAWLTSRNVTRPLNKLTAAATAIADGNYNGPVDIKRQHELGKPAAAFNTMAVEVQNAQRFLEKKVNDRTADLEKANKKMEAFCYSVSHDLQAPLRIINGYAEMLLEKHSGALNDDARRILCRIQQRARRMKLLIEELPNLWYMGLKKLAVELVDINAIVHTVINEQVLPKEQHVAIEVKNLEPAFFYSTLIM